MTIDEMQLAEYHRANIRTAVEILKKAGCSEIFLFGSILSKDARKSSDIDIAVRGCPKNKFFGVLGELLCKLDCSVDLVDLDEEDDFAKFLIENEEIRKIA